MDMTSDAMRRGGALVVGASSGIGAALAGHLVEAGYRVALVARRSDALQALCARLNGGAAPDAAPRASAYSADVRDFAAAPAVFARIAADVAPLRLVIYAAGIMPPTTTGSDFVCERDEIETNLLGAMRWLALAAEHLRGAGGGTVVGISSVAGERGRPGNGAYMASKAALTTYLDSLRYQLHASDVRVVTIKPGLVATPMVAGRQLPRALTISAERAARRIVQAAAHGPTVVYVPGYWRWIMWLVRLLPASAVARVPG